MKISPEEIKRIISRLDDRNIELDNDAKILKSSLEELKNIIICDGINEKMDELSTQIRMNTGKVNNLFVNISYFMKRQLEEYESSTVEAKSGITVVNEELGNIQQS